MTGIGPPTVAEPLPDADLREHDHPCVCGRFPDEHDDGGCPEYQPDHARVCAGCGGDGAAPLAWPYGCPWCDGRGWV